MSYRPRRHGRAAVFVLMFALSLSLTQALASEAVLLASTVPGYAPGMVVSASDRLTIPDGASVTLLFQSGEMMRLGGPFEGTLEKPASKPDAGAVALADLFRMNGVDATSIGGTRAMMPGQSSLAIDDVEVDPERSGTYCVQPSTSVWLARPAVVQHSYAVGRKRARRMLNWPQEAARVEWPADVPIDDGSQFDIAADGTSRATVTFRTMPGDVSPGPAEVATGILFGCHAQYDGALRRVSRAVATPQLWMTTDHGRKPSYHPGESVVLTLMAATEGFLYCVAESEDAGTIPIFPVGSVDGAQIPASEPLSIPGRRQSVGLTAKPGLQQIRCWEADRDITPELPKAVVAPTMGRIPDQLAGSLDSVFGSIRGTRIEADVLTLRVE